MSICAPFEIELDARGVISHGCFIGKFPCLFFISNCLKNRAIGIILPAILHELNRNQIGLIFASLNATYMFPVLLFHMYGFVPALMTLIIISQLKRKPEFRGSFREGELTLLSNLLALWLQNLKRSSNWPGFFFQSVMMITFLPSKALACSLMLVSFVSQDIFGLLRVILADWKLLLWWPSCLSFILAFCVFATHRNVATHALRKFYHFAAVAVFIPALWWNQKLLSLGLGFAALILYALEWIRLTSKFPHFDAFIAKCRSEERDGGPFTLSHLYLLLGCALPVWMGKTRAERAAGIICLGLGNSMAALIGRLAGDTLRWKGKKSVQGAVAGAVAMSVAFSFLLPWRQAVGVALGAAGWEMFTDLNDNLTMPMVGMILIRIIK